MKNIINRCLAIVILLTSASAFAAFNTSPLNVTAIEIAGTAGTQYSWVYVSSAPNGMPGCATGSSTRLGIATADPGAKEIFSAAQAALLAGKQVHIQLTGSCISNHALINGLRLLE